MTEHIDTAKLREIAGFPCAASTTAVPVESCEPMAVFSFSSEDIEKARWLTKNGPALADEIDRLREENARLRDERRTAIRARPRQRLPQQRIHLPRPLPPADRQHRHGEGRMSGAASRAKGRRGQTECGHLLTERGYDVARRY